MAQQPAVSLRDLRLSRAGGAVLSGISLDVMAGTATAVIGRRDHAAASLVLRAACGLVEVTGGQVRVDGRDVTSEPPHRRRLAWVNAPAAPMSGSVGRAVAAAARGEIGAALTICALADHADRPVARLSAGLRKRVALARALAAAPAAILIDHPSAGLEADEVEAMHAAVLAARHAGVAMLIATDRPAEAFALADGGVLVSGSTMRQAGPIHDLYERPADAVSYAMLGHENRLPGIVLDETDGTVSVRLDDGPVVHARHEDAAPGSRCLVCIRPHRIAIVPANSGPMEGSLAGTVETARPTGDVVRLQVRLAEGGTRLVVARSAVLPWRNMRSGAAVSLAWPDEAAWAFKAPAD